MKKHIVFRFIFIFSVFVLLWLYYNKILSLSWASSLGVSFSLTIVASTGSASSGNISTGNISTGNISNKNSISSSISTIKVLIPKISTGIILTGKSITGATGTIIQLTGIVVITGGHSSATTIAITGGISQTSTITNGKTIQIIDSAQDNVTTAVVKKVDQFPSLSNSIETSPSPNVNANNQSVIFKFTEIPEKKDYKKIKIIESIINVLKPIIKNNIESLPILNKIANKVVRYSNNDVAKPEQIKTTNTGKLFENNNNGFMKTTKSIFNDVLMIIGKNDNVSIPIPFMKKPIAKPIYPDITDIQQIKNKLYSISTNTVSILRKKISDILPLNGTVLFTVRSIFKYFK